MIITFAEYSANINFSKLKSIVNRPDTYEKLKLLEKQLTNYSGNKKNYIYRLAVYEYNKLKKEEKKLLREKKSRIEEKYSIDTIKKKKVSLDITIDDLEVLVKNLYASYIDTKKFKKKCKGLKNIIVFI